MAGVALLVLIGLGSRLAFLGAVPTLPFFDALQLIHFGELLHSNGVAAPGWYWAQFNPGLPLILAVLFRTGLPAVDLARTATALITGLLGLLPFLIWRDVLAFRWRLVSGALLALWPGQIVFSGVVVQDNWVLPPAIALACLAVRQLRSPEGRGRPVLAALLFAACFAIRLEMLVALAPLAIAAGMSSGASGRRRRDIATMVTVLGLSTLLLCLQRQQATGRFTIATEHGALGLFGSFMPGSGSEGWIDGRAYAAARQPSLARGLFGSPQQLLRLTLEEVERRPAFHALRIISWLPRLAIDADSDALYWSMGVSRALSPEIRPRAEAFQRYARPLLTAELALIQGAFAAALLVGLSRRRSDILVLASAVALKFAIHMLVSPLGRLVVPGIALELLAIPLGGEALTSLNCQQRLKSLVFGVGTSLALLTLTPPLARVVSRLDSRELPGIRTFHLDAGDACSVRCEVRRGAVVGLTPASAAVFAVAGREAFLDCSLPVVPPDTEMELEIEARQEQVLADGEILRPSSPGTYLTPRPNSVSALTIKLPPGSIGTTRFSVRRRTPPSAPD